MLNDQLNAKIEYFFVSSYSVLRIGLNEVKKAPIDDEVNKRATEKGQSKVELDVEKRK